MPMIRPELRSLECLYPDVLLNEFSPRDPEDVKLRVEAYIGIAGREGADMFDFLVRTPRALAAEVTKQGYIFGRSYLILPRFEYTLLWQAISDLCAQIEG